MANISAADVNKLRQMTGVGMMDCKKALVECDGDFDKAIDFLRQKGQKLAAKRAERDANEGVVLAKTNGSFGAVVMVNCETDFVANNADFVAFTQSILDNAVANRFTAKEDVLEMAIDGRKVADLLTDQIAKIGEKIDLAHYEAIEGAYQGKMSMNKSIVESNRRIRYEVKLEEEKKNDEYLREHNAAQRELDRILTIYKAVVVFLNTPLMVEVGKTPMLKPPITRTNVLKMNRNFREALSLYEFVTAYDGDGYTITTETRTVSPFVGVIGEEMAETVELALFLTYEHGLGIKDYLKAQGLWGIYGNQLSFRWSNVFCGADTQT